MKIEREEKGSEYDGSEIENDNVESAVDVK